jgi:hypothetical protein
MQQRGSRGQHHRGGAQRRPAIQRADAVGTLERGARAQLTTEPMTQETGVLLPPLHPVGTLVSPRCGCVSVTEPSDGSGCSRSATLLWGVSMRLFASRALRLKLSDPPRIARTDTHSYHRARVISSSTLAASGLAPIVCSRSFSARRRLDERTANAMPTPIIVQTTASDSRQPPPVRTKLNHQSKPTNRYPPASHHSRPVRQLVRGSGVDEVRRPSLLGMGADYPSPDRDERRRCATRSPNPDRSVPVGSPGRDVRRRSISVWPDSNSSWDAGIGCYNYNSATFMRGTGRGPWGNRAARSPGAPGASSHQMIDVADWCLSKDARVPVPWSQVPGPAPSAGHAGARLRQARIGHRQQHFLPSSAPADAMYCSARQWAVQRRVRR